VRLKSFLRNTAKIAILLVAIDRILMPLPFAALMPYFYSPTKATDAKATRSFTREKDLGALEYLVLAHSMSYDSLDYDKNDCKGYAIETFRTYKDLTEQDNRPDLADDARIAFGNVSFENSPRLHVWVEIKQDNEWKPYETTLPGATIEDSWTLKTIVSMDIKYDWLTSKEITGYLPITTMQTNQSAPRINPRWFYKSIGWIIPAACTTYSDARDYISKLSKDNKNPKDSK